jgi:drug/metabolite transporter (DMT)-like permease
VSRAYVWAAIAVIVTVSTAGDVLLSKAMKQVGDLGELWRSEGLWTVARRTFSNPTFVLGVCAVAVGFFSLLTGLSWGDLSLVGPASASLTVVANAIAAKFLLHEHVDHRRWTAALLVAGGVVLLTL